MHPVLFHIGRVVVPSYGVVTALGVLIALVFSQRTARTVRINPVKIWNLCILSLCSAVVAARLLLVAVNWTILRIHPAWVLSLAMVHHPLLAAIGALAGTGCAVWYTRRSKLPLFTTADALASPLALGIAFEQVGALLAGAGYGTAASPHIAWAVTYTNPLAFLWSGAPLDLPVHPVQIYAAMAFLALAVVLYAWLPFQRRAGDIAGIWLMGAGVSVYFTEFWRDPEGRGNIFHGAFDGPQIAAVALVLAGAFILRERAITTTVSPDAPDASVSRCAV